MLYNKSHFFLLVALIAAHLIFAQETSNSTTTEANSANQSDSHSNSSQNGDADNQAQDRFFFFTRFVGCNYTAQAGRTCANCRQTLLCLPSNVGILKTCHGFLPYCNEGRCSYVRGPACNTTSSG